jgi:hypothetical protein
MAGFGKRSLIAATILVTACAVQLAKTAQAPADACSLLPAAQVSKVVAQDYGSPQKSVAPSPFPGTVEGTDCNYAPKGAGNKLWFRVYFDPSPSAATDLFARLKTFYSPPTPVPGIGDDTYFDPHHGLHVRKGNVRFFLSFRDTGSVTPANESQLKDLARRIAGQL